MPRTQLTRIPLQLKLISMSTLNEIETAVSRLSSDELGHFRRWFAEFDADCWDEQIEQDVRAGRLDSLADQALQHLRSGRCGPL